VHWQEHYMGGVWICYQFGAIPETRIVGPLIPHPEKVVDMLQKINMTSKKRSVNCHFCLHLFTCWY